MTVIGLALFPDRVNDPEIWGEIVSATFTTVTVAGDLTSYAEASSEYAVRERGWVYDSGSDMTFYFDMGNGFPAFAGNWTFVPDIEKPCHLQAQGVDGNLLYFKGDTRNLAAPETDRYMLLPPAGISATTGAYAKPEDLGENDYTDRGTMWLWSGYLYVTPQVGHDVTGTTYGAQSGGNKLGSYHCWNRVYEPATGRWTTPDPAMSPWMNVVDYSLAQPLVSADPSGLFSIKPTDVSDWNNPPEGPAVDVTAIDRLILGGNAGFDPDDHYEVVWPGQARTRQRAVNRIRDSLLRADLLERLELALYRLRVLSKRFGYNYDKNYKPFGEGIDDNTPTVVLGGRVRCAEREADKEMDRHKDKYVELYGEEDPFYKKYDHPAQATNEDEYARKKGCKWDWYCVHEVQLKYAAGATLDALCDVYCHGAKECASSPGKAAVLPYYAAECASCTMAAWGVNWWDNYKFQKCCK